MSIREFHTSGRTSELKSLDINTKSSNDGYFKVFTSNNYVSIVRKGI